MDCELGYCNINLNEVEIKNALFLVFEDSLLSFGGGYYVINGIIGFPVINALKEISLLNDSVLFIPEKPRLCSYSNFALDNLNPTILVVYNNDSLPFHFDTGADRTLLFSSFYKKYKDEIVENYSTIESSVSGAGGSTYTKVYLIDSLKISAGENKATLDSIELLTDDLLHGHKIVYGNFGQDYMRKFSTININFESMCIKFSNNHNR
jgi:hypothetical protein